MIRTRASRIIGVVTLIGMIYVPIQFACHYVS